MSEKKYFWPHLYADLDSEPVLAGALCKHCGHVTFPKNELCVYCGKKEMEEIRFGKRGVLYSYTITRMPVERWTPPHAIGQISFPDSHVRIIAPLWMEGDDDVFEIGEEVELVFARYWDDEETGEEIVGYYYRPVRGPAREGGGQDA